MSDPIISRSQARRILEQTEAPAIAALTAQVAALRLVIRNAHDCLEGCSGEHDEDATGIDAAMRFLADALGSHPPAGEGK